MRYRHYLRERYQAMLGYMGELLITIGIIYLAPLLVIPFFPNELNLGISFLVVGSLTIGTGWFLSSRLQTHEQISLELAEGSVLILAAWLIAILIGTVPFMVVDNLNFTLAVFESCSGWTGTGLTIVDVTSTSKIILFYRSVIQLAGGAGFAIIAVSSIAAPGGLGLSTAEGRTEQLVPHIRESASIVVRIYAVYTILGVLALWVAGMSAFDAVNHGFGAIATGGFSTRIESIGYWDDPVIEAIIIVLMLFGTLNFLTAYTLFRGKLEPFIRNGEVRLVALLVPLMSGLLMLGVTIEVYEQFDKAIRVAIFEVISALTTTGYSSVTYGAWMPFGWLILTLAMVIGGGSGSTSGGIKQFRIYVLIKGLRWEFQRAFLPTHAVNEPVVWQGEERGFLTDTKVRGVALFVFLYTTVLMIGTGIVSLHGHSIDASLFEFASSLGTAGLSVGVTSPDAPLSLLWTLIVGMFLGRLEFFAVIIGIFKIASDAREWMAEGRQ